MLELVNETPWAAGLYPGWGPDRRFRFTAVFKAAWRFDDQGLLRPLEPPPDIVEADAHHGAPHETGLAEALETAPFKAGGEYYLQGTAHPRDGARAMRVAVEIHWPDGSRHRKQLAVFGRRAWRRGLFGPVMSEPEPLAPTPLRYELAFGGRVGEAEFEANPVGRGFNPSAWRLDQPEPPCIEYPERLVTRPGDKPPPAGFGPLPAFWQPRRDEAGTPAQDPLAAEGCPWGEDAEPCLHNCAPPDQRLAQPFQGGERLRLTGFFPERDAIEIELPALEVEVWRVSGDDWQACTPRVDTLVIDTDAMTLALIGRAPVPGSLLAPRPGMVLLRPRRDDARQRHENSLEGAA